METHSYTHITSAIMCEFCQCVSYCCQHYLSALENNMKFAINICYTHTCRQAITCYFILCPKKTFSATLNDLCKLISSLHYIANLKRSCIKDKPNMYIIFICLIQSTAQHNKCNLNRPTQWRINKNCCGYYLCLFINLLSIVIRTHK